MKIPLFLLLLSLGGPSSYGATNQTKEPWPPEAKVTVKVVDEARQPIPGAEVWFQFYEKETTGRVNVRGLTDSEGLFAGQGYSQDTKVGAKVTKEGYYWSSAPIPEFLRSQGGKMQPWNPTVETLLRKIGNLSPLYAKSAWIEVPATNIPCGYDLELGDWVVPFGKGRTADFVFSLARQYENRDKFDVSVFLSFANPADGIQETAFDERWLTSTFRWLRQAPESGYQTNLVSKSVAVPGTAYTKSAKDDQAYYFRVRTVERGGHIVSSRYGKIRGGLKLSPSNSKTVKLYLTYYLNANALDRNMEFDLTRNLLKNIGQFESPREP